MTASRKMFLLMPGLFIAIYLLGAALYVHQARLHIEYGLAAPAWFVVIVMVLCFLALLWTMKRALEPVAQLAGALEREQQTVILLTTQLLKLQDRERERIAQALHDDLGQYITGIRAQATSWVYDPDLNTRQKQQASNLAGHCETLQQHFRHLLQDLHPLALEQRGLGSAIAHLAEQWRHLSGLDCQLSMDDQLMDLSGEQQTHLYRFLQEALNNVSRHANATGATLAVKQNADALHIELCDNGAGADNLFEKSGLGLRSMRERARCLGGRARFVSKTGEGTRVQLTVPLTRPCASGGMQ